MLTSTAYRVAQKCAPEPTQKARKRWPWQNRNVQSRRQEPVPLSEMVDVREHLSHPTDGDVIETITLWDAEGFDNEFTAFSNERTPPIEPKPFDEMRGKSVDQALAQECIVIYDAENESVNDSAFVLVEPGCGKQSLEEASKKSSGTRKSGEKAKAGRWYTKFRSLYK